MDQILIHLLKTNSFHYRQSLLEEFIQRLICLMLTVSSLKVAVYSIKAIKENFVRFLPQHFIHQNYNIPSDNRDFPKWNWNSVNSTNSGNLINHWIRLYLKILSLPFLAGNVVASWFLTQEVAGSNPLTTNIFSGLPVSLANRFHFSFP